MQCCVDGCDRNAQYKAVALCQKHYFRVRRNGTTEIQGRKDRLESSLGYQWVFCPDHPLRHVTTGYVAEHRAVLYECIGPEDMSCELCGVGLSWKTCKVDHIDRNVRNNHRENLRPTCNRCNTWRDMRPASEWKRTIAITHAGETKTAAEWSRDPRVNLSGRQIRERIRSGMSDVDALFAPKKTHKSKPPNLSD